MMWLRQNTACTILLGPFVGTADGYTANTGLAASLTAANVRLSKAGAAFAAKNDATASTHSEFGWYVVSLNATDTNTLGQLIAAVNLQASSVLPLWREFQIVTQAVWDAHFGAGVMPANVTQVGGTAQTAGDIYGAINTRLPAALQGGRMDSSVGAMAANVINAGAIAPDAVGASELAADAVAEIADQVWDEVLSGHLTAGSTGAALNGAGSAGDPWTTPLPGAYGAGSAGAIIGGRLDQNVGSRATPADVLVQANAALDTTFSLPAQMAPPGIASIRQGIAFLYKAWRNRTVQTNNEYRVYSEDGGSIDQKASVSANANQVDRAKVGSGP